VAEHGSPHLPQSLGKSNELLRRVFQPLKLRCQSLPIGPRKTPTCITRSAKKPRHALPVQKRIDPTGSRRVLTKRPESSKPPFERKGLARPRKGQRAIFGGSAQGREDGGRR
jgi:hypothetical protein